MQVIIVFEANNGLPNFTLFRILEHCVLLGNWHYDFLSKRCSGELSAVICLTQELQKPKELFSTTKFFEMKSCFVVFFHEYKKTF